MSEAYKKAILTRTKRLSEAFQVEHDRIPTVEELSALYSEEMRRTAAKSSRNNAGTGGFAKLSKENPEKFKEVTSRGGKTSKRGPSVNT